jgi:hypothetical protein
MQSVENVDQFENVCHNTLTNDPCVSLLIIFLYVHHYLYHLIHMETAKGTSFDTVEDYGIVTGVLSHVQLPTLCVATVTTIAFRKKKEKNYNAKEIR